MRYPLTLNTKIMKPPKEPTIEDHIAKAHENAAHVWSLIDEDIKAPDAILYYNNSPVIFKNSTILIQGKTGTHKSRFASALVSLLITDESEKSMYGFSRPKTSALSAIYADTERDKNNQLPLMLQQLLRDTNLEIDQLKERMILLPLSEIPRDFRLHVMGREVSSLSKNDKGSIAIIMDVISDFSKDFNSVDSTNAINDILNLANSMFDVTFIVIIHENPGRPNI